MQNVNDRRGHKKEKRANASWTENNTLVRKLNEETLPPTLRDRLRLFQRDGKTILQPSLGDNESTLFAFIKRETRIGLSDLDVWAGRDEKI